MNLTWRRCIRAIAWFWLGWGIGWLASSTDAALPLRLLLDSPTRFEGIHTSISGYLRLGLESSVLYPNDSPVYKTDPANGISVSFDEPAFQWLSRCPLESYVVVVGDFHHKPTGGFGHFGLWRSQLAHAAIIQYPRWVNILFWFLCFFIPSIIALWIGRSEKKKKDNP
jgi:hypothetical protein